MTIADLAVTLWTQPWGGWVVVAWLIAAALGQMSRDRATRRWRQAVLVELRRSRASSPIDTGRGAE